MPEPYYASPSNLAQITPGELSTDQAIRSFYYIDDDPNKFLLNYAYRPFTDGESFWDSVATSLTVGSYITCLGKAEAETSLKSSIATVRVISIERDSDYKYKYRVRTSIGPNTLFSNQAYTLGQSQIQNISGMELRYKGIVQAQDVHTQTHNLFLGANSGIDKHCWIWGVTTNVPEFIYPNTFVIAHIKAQPTENWITIVFANNNFPTSPTLFYFYMEAYKPISPLY